MKLGLILAMALTVVSPAAAQKISEPGHYEGWSKAEFDGPTLTTAYVTAPDGTRLAADIYRPANNGVAATGKFPTLFLYSPYRRAYRDGDDVKLGSGLVTRDGGPAREITDLTRHGYVIVAADVRGKGASFGTRLAPNDRIEARDGAAIVDWIADQPWSDGKVGMFGCSYYGGTTWGVVTERPKALKAAMIGCTAFDKYEGFGGRGGIKISQLLDTTIEQDLLTRPVNGDEAALRAAVEQHRANTEAGALVRSLPYRDSRAPGKIGAFWEATSIHNFLPEINRPGIAIYMQGGWNDIVRRDTVLAFANLKVPRKMLIGPWGHCVTTGFDYLAEMHRFFDYWLKDIDNGIMREPAVTYFEAGSETWKTAPTWPLPGQTTASLYLGGSGGTSLPNQGTLLSARDKGGSSSFEVVRDIVTYRVGVGAARPVVPGEYRDARGLTFTTGARNEPVTLTGHPVARLWIAAAERDADVFAYLSDIAPDGTITTISEGQLRASHRKPGEAPYDTLGLPFHAGREADMLPLSPNAPTLMEFEMLPLAHQVQPGHRLRLTITGDNANGAGMPPATRPAKRLTILHDAAHPSRIELPVVTR